MAYLAALLAVSGCPHPPIASSPDSAAILTAIATIVAAGAAVWAVCVAVKAANAAVNGVEMARTQIEVSNSIKKAALISEAYSDFAEPPLSEFYRRIRNGWHIHWESDKRDEDLLNRSLTVFDSVSFLRTQVEFGAAEWEYVASEIKYFALHPSVWAYMADTIAHAKERGFPDKIIPFTGFYELYCALRDDPNAERARATPFPPIPEEHRVVFEGLFR